MKSRFKITLELQNGETLLINDDKWDQYNLVLRGHDSDNCYAPIIREAEINDLIPYRLFTTPNPIKKLTIEDVPQTLQRE
ncbi:MAG: hypothetical protein WC907_06670 [Acholeplasmataceae bacterium]|jgi:hypothetical protein